MRRRVYLPGLNPVLMDLALVITISLLMSVVFVATAYMVYVRLSGQ